jgi:hypothetical protein
MLPGDKIYIPENIYKTIPGTQSNIVSGSAIRNGCSNKHAATVKSRFTKALWALVLVDMLSHMPS